MSGVIAVPGMDDLSEVLALSMPHPDDRDGYVMIPSPRQLQDYSNTDSDSGSLAQPSQYNRSADEIARACQWNGALRPQASLVSSGILGHGSRAIVEKVTMPFSNSSTEPESMARKRFDVRGDARLKRLIDKEVRILK
jgi:hypothetical protein